MPGERLIVIGGGPAGYTASLYLARAGLDPLCIEGYAAGGQLLTTTMVDNFPGFPQGVLGPELAESIRAQAERFGARFLMRDVSAVDLSSRPFHVMVGNEVHTADALVIATGATAKTLGLDSELALTNHGVAYCSVCDGPLFAGRRVAVVGGGDAAMEEALTLQRFASEVLVIHRRDEFRATRVMFDSVRAAGIELLTPFVVEEVLGLAEGHVTGARLRDTETGETRVEELAGLFVAIGHHPATDLVAGQLECDEEGYIIVEPGRTTTSIEGVFAAGDVQDKLFRQAVTASGSGCMAALEAQRWLAERAQRRLAGAPLRHAS
jgi:thioredoxin reductase (NADPH)